MTTQSINCPLHGFITLTPRMRQIVDTSEFKRLHKLRQLGVTYFVYPSANHTRFEHSLGVSHLAKLLMISLSKKNIDLNINENLIELVQIAGLVHDIGHGPFSHLYDDLLLNPEDPHHEERGIQIFQKMIQKYNLPFTAQEVKFIIQLINPNEENKNNWLYQIIANKYCSIDVDKIDYIQRDSYHLGFGLSEKYERLITMADVKLLDNNLVLAWPEKLQDEIMSLFETRYRLHKKVYCHHTVKAIEYIVVEILREIINNTQLSFEDLSDDIISFPFGNEKIKELKKNLDFRKFPKLIGEKIIAVNPCPDSTEEEKLEKIINKLLEILTQSGIKHKGISKCKIGFISGNGENPLINVPYFKKTIPDAYKINHYASFMAPQNCQEYIYRIYTNNEMGISEARSLWTTFIR